MSPRTRPLVLVPLALLAVAATQLLVALGDAPIRVVVSDGVDAAVLLVAGGWVWRRRPDARTGWLLALAGLSVGVNNLVYLEDAPALRLLGMLALPAFIPPLMLALLGFPSGRVDGIDRRLVTAAVGVTTIGWWAVLTTYEPRPGGPASVPMPLPSREVYEVLSVGHGCTCGVLALLTAWRVLANWRASTPAARRLYAPVMISGAVTAVVVGVSGPFGERVVDGIPAPTAVVYAWAIGFAAVPTAILVTLLRQRRSRLPLSRVLAALRRTNGGEELRGAVAEALGDPTVELAFRLPDAEGWRDAHGRPIDLQGRRGVTPLGPGAARTALVHDPALLEHPLLLETVARTVAMALDRERLSAEVRAQLHEAGAVRARIVRASDAARRRIERDLHDGAQQTLVSLALALSMLEEELEADGDDLALRLVRHAAAQADAALTELRDIARGVFPALLVVDGLQPALEELAAGAPIPVRFEANLGRRFAPEVEAAAFFLVREGLTNAVVHGRARSAAVRADLEDDVLHVEVADDGTGGAALVPGGGLEQLADRVAALGGRLDVGNGPQGGTRLAARLGAAAVPARMPDLSGDPVGASGTG